MYLLKIVFSSQYQMYRKVIPRISTKPYKTITNYINSNLPFSLSTMSCKYEDMSTTTISAQE